MRKLAVFDEMLPSLPFGHGLEPADDERRGHVEGQVADDVDIGWLVVPRASIFGRETIG